MPLMKGKSEKAFSHNVGAEMDSGKPQKQALAIAYAIKRRAQKKARGGEIEPSMSVDEPETKGFSGESSVPAKEDENRKLHPGMGEDPMKAIAKTIMMKSAKAYNSGGEVEDEIAEENQMDDALHDPIQHQDFLSDEADGEGPPSPKAILSKILARVRMKHMGM